MSFFLSTQGIRIQQEPASFAARLAAFCIDFLLMLIAGIALFHFIDIFHVYEIVNYSLCLFLSYFIPYLYPLVSETLANGQTVGKHILHIRVVTIEGGGPSMTSFILRWLLLPIDAFASCGIGPLCLFFTKRQQRFGDLVAGTWVVRTQEYAKVDFSSLVAED